MAQSQTPGFCVSDFFHTACTVSGKPTVQLMCTQKKQKCYSLILNPRRVEDISCCLATLPGKPTKLYF